MDADRALVEAAAGGDRDAFDELVRRHGSAMIGLCRALIGGRGDAEDLAQEVFIRAWKSLKTFRGESTFRTWLHRVAVNVARTHHGNRGKIMRLFRSAAPHDEDPPDTAEPIDTRLARRDIVERALATLPSDLREALTLRDLQGLDYKEIAQTLDVPIGTIESRIFRARQRLRPLLAALMDGQVRS
ncbi:MAG TPA: sigma-70 family RNA polymerase sigma factor [Vicinamibacterales bacterium]|nr:sigma-70 family RNA polymerase sigma factor [Vicinamibacterales bacterium]